MATQARQIVWVDAMGRTTVTVPRADPDNSGIMTQLALLSNAGIFSWFEGPVTLLTPSPVSAEFADIADNARLTFTDSGGSLVNLALPAPQAAIFESDTVTVDPSAIADLITACVGTLVSSAGSPVTAFVAGLRNQRSSLR